MRGRRCADDGFPEIDGRELRYAERFGATQLITESTMFEENKKCPVCASSC